MGLATRIGKVPNGTSGIPVDSLAPDAPPGGTGATAGAYDTAVNRDLMIATVNGLNATVASILEEFTKLKADVSAHEAQLNSGE
jgi:hypothetical protein